MFNSPILESILNELDNPNLFAEEREALQVMAAVLTEKWEKEMEKRESKMQAA